MITAVECAHIKLAQYTVRLIHFSVLETKMKMVAMKTTCVFQEEKLILENIVMDIVLLHVSHPLISCAMGSLFFTGQKLVAIQKNSATKSTGTLTESFAHLIPIHTDAP